MIPKINKYYHFWDDGKIYNHILETFSDDEEFLNKYKNQTYE